MAHSIIAGAMYRPRLSDFYVIIILANKLIASVFYDCVWDDYIDEDVFKNREETDRLKLAYRNLMSIRFLMSTGKNDDMIQAANLLVSCLTNMCNYYNLPPEMVVYDVVYL